MKTIQRPQLPDLLAVLSPIVRSTMLEYFNATCCIGTCRILIDVFKYYGYRARPFPVTVAIYNRAMMELIERQELPDNPDQRRALFEQTGAWGVGIMPKKDGMILVNDTTSDKDYNGHLVLNVDGLLVDGSIQQAQRVHKGIELPPLLWFAPVPAGFFAARAKGQKTSGMVNSSALMTYRRLDDDSYRNSPNWREEYAGVPEAYLKILTMASLVLARSPILATEGTLGAVARRLRTISPGKLPEAREKR